MNESIPANPLLYVPSQPSRSIKADLKAAGIPFRTEAGKLDFHACRVAYINMVIRSGADIKTAQALARHSTPELTLNVYGRENRDLMATAARGVGAVIASRTPDTASMSLDRAACHFSATSNGLDASNHLQYNTFTEPANSGKPHAGVTVR